MLSIGITICDKDYQKLDSLLAQIEERIKIEHEVIIIDNREQFKDEKTSWTPSYSFGYNAYQFSARAKIIELAKGDYIWFVDGDDNVEEVDEFDYTEDIIVFSYHSYPSGDIHIDENVYTENLFSYDISTLIRPVLWNKFVKRSLFTKEFIKRNFGKKIVTNEDTLWGYEALRNASSLRIVDKIIYHHNEGLSNRVDNVSLAEFESLVTGFEEMKEETRRIIKDDTFFNKSMYDTACHLMRYATKTKEPYGVLDIMLKLIPWELFKEALFDSVYPFCKSQENLNNIIKHLSKNFGGEPPFKQVREMVTFEDGSVREVFFTQTIEFDKL